MNKIKNTFKEYVFDSEKIKYSITNNELKEKYKMNKKYVFAGILVFVALALFSYAGFKILTNKNNTFEIETPKTEPVSFLTININPEIELGLDEQDKVVEVMPINDDADVLTTDLNLVGLTVEEASDKIIDAAMETGQLDEYSDENTVVVTTVNDNETKRSELQEKIITRMNAHFETKKIYPVLVANGLDDDLKADALKYGISNGKMLLIERAVSLDKTLSKDDLAKMTIQDIQTKIRTYVKERREALKLSLQEAKDKWKEEKDNLKQQYLEKVEELKNSISEERKEELKNMTPDQKKEAIKNYLNAKKDIIKNDINAIKDQIKAEVKDNMKDYNYPVLENNAETIKEKIKERIAERRKNK